VRPRIAVVADWWWPDSVGGAERSSRAVALELARTAEVAVFVPSTVDRTYPDGPLAVHAVRRPFARRVHADSVPRRGVEFLTAWLLPPVVRRLVRRIRAFGPDVVVAHNVSRTGPWLVRAVRTGAVGRTGFVRCYHDLSDTCWRRSRLKGAKGCTDVCAECRGKAWLMRRATPSGTVGVCVSDFVRRELTTAGLTTPERSIVGYPMTGTPTIPKPRRPDSGLVLGYIGRLDRVKGVHAAIRTAAAYRRATGRRASLVAAGEGRDGYVRELAALASAVDVDVVFPGHLDVADFCDRVDAVLVPSTWLEPFGRVVVEVGSRGRPMLISPLGGLPEAAAVSGGRFAFADFGDPDAAARSLAELLDPAFPGAPAPAAARSAVPLEQGVAQAVKQVAP